MGCFNVYMHCRPCPEKQSRVEPINEPSRARRWFRAEQNNEEGGVTGKDGEGVTKREGSPEGRAYREQGARGGMGFQRERSPRER